MQRKDMDWLLYWLPIIGGLLLGGFAVGAWYGGHKIAGVWLGFSGVLCFALLAALQVQKNVLSAGLPPPIDARNVDGPVVSIHRFAFEAIPTSKETPGALEFRAIVKNSGRTPALNMKLSFNLSGKSSLLADDFDYADVEGKENPYTAILAPGQELEAGPFKITADYVERIRRRSVYLFFYGWIEYDDRFEGTKRHRTEFCWQFEVAGEPPPSERALIVTQYGPYNCIDKNCRYAPEHHPPKKPGNPSEHLTVLE